MKKAITALLILSIIFCSIPSRCEETDPIIGCWYANIPLDGEIKIPGYENYIREVLLLTFEKNGDITRCSIDFDGKTPVVSGPAIVGKWSKAEGINYSISIIAAGTSKAYIVGGVLFAMALVKDVYYGFHKMDTFDWYSEMYYSYN